MDSGKAVTGCLRVAGSVVCKKMNLAQCWQWHYSASSPKPFRHTEIQHLCYFISFYVSPSYDQYLSGSLRNSLKHAYFGLSLSLDSEQPFTTRSLRELAGFCTCLVMQKPATIGPTCRPLVT